MTEASSSFVEANLKHCMKSLSPNWFIDAPLDAEHKQYMLLGYLQSIQQHFDAKQLYPQLGDLLTHYLNIVQFRDSKAALQMAFPKRLTAIDLHNFRLAFDKAVADDSLMQSLNDIVNFSIPKMKDYLEQGRSIFDGFESHITMKPIGLVPLYLEEGYLLLRLLPIPKSDINVYRYQITLFENENNRYRGIHTQYLCTYEYSLSNQYEHIKKDLVSKRADLPNPVAFAFEATTELPLEETLLPIARRKLITTINNSI
ncbi:MAG: hypothetical protein EXR21_06550 [Flavobacteriaceae bacterium]|nr:hypothetical protein [Flavobacteriaceae bacterium]